MDSKSFFGNHGTQALAILKWTFLAIPTSLLIGSACALFLWSLDWATQTRWNHPWLLYLLPLFGILIVEVYSRFGAGSERGNNLLIDEIHEPGGGVPLLRMAPLILGGTILTHLGGGSAGREGTAVQMGGSLAAGIARALSLGESTTRVLLMVGIAAGFGGVFGTPVAGAIFASEVLHIGKLRYETLLPCLIGGIFDWGCRLWGIGHLDYAKLLTTPPTLNGLLLAKIIVAAILFGWTARLFAASSHGLLTFMRKTFDRSWLPPLIGSLCLILLVWILGTRDYLGLGVHLPEGKTGVSIVSSFHPGGAGFFSWFWKLLFTVITLGSGFKGGEVTPLFFIGAALGNSLAVGMGAPIDLFAAIGLIALFAAATNTPIASTLMGIELFGAAHAPSFAIACSIAYLFSGDHGIYTSQRTITAKRLG